MRFNAALREIVCKIKGLIALSPFRRGHTGSDQTKRILAIWIALGCAMAIAQPNESISTINPTESASGVQHIVDPLDGAAGAMEILGKMYRVSLAAMTPPNSLAANDFKPVLRFLPAGSMAPATVHVHAVATPPANGSAITARYEWDFGDPAGRYNQLTGFNAAHVYDKPGQYTITLRMTDETGAQTQRSARITVIPDARRTIYVAANGNDANDGSDEAHPIRTFARAAQLLKDQTKILFRRGDTFDVNNRMQIKFRDVMIGAYGGSGIGDQGSEIGKDSIADPQPPIPDPPLSRPLLQWIGPRNGGSIFTISREATDTVIENLRFDSIYNNDSEQSGMPHIICPQGLNITLRNCEFLNVGYAINSNSRPTGVLAMDNTAPLPGGVRGYFAWVQGSDHVYLGNQVANSTREHCLRAAGADRVLVAHNEFTNLDRRIEATGGQQPATSQPLPATDPQPPIPAPQIPDPHDIAKGCIVLQQGSFFYITANTITGGPMGAGPLGGPDGAKPQAAASKTQHVVIENNRLTNSMIHLQPGAQHIMLRNNLIQRDRGICIDIKCTDPSSEIYKDRAIINLRILNNTLVLHGDRQNFLKVLGIAGESAGSHGPPPGTNGGALGSLGTTQPSFNQPPGQIEFVNNLMIGPNLTPPSGAAVYIQADDLRLFSRIENNLWPRPAALESGKGILFLSRREGPQAWLKPDAWKNFPQVQGDQFENIQLDKNHAPLSASPATLQAKPAAGVWDDLNGQPRLGDVWTIGAVERR